MSLRLRAARVSDVDSLFHVRTSVNENRLSRQELKVMGVTKERITDMISGSSCAWVAVEGDRIIGFSMITPENGCLFATFVLPDYEGSGIGKRLVNVAEDALFRQHATIWLETDKNSRAAGFYRHLGWADETAVGKGDIRLAKHRPDTGRPSSARY